MDFITEIGNSLPILFVVLAGIIVAMARRLETAFSGRAKAQKECAEEIATLKDAVRNATFRSKHLNLSLGREKECLKRAVTLGRFYKDRAIKLQVKIDKNSEG